LAATFSFNTSISTPYWSNARTITKNSFVGNHLLDVRLPK